MIQHAYTDFVVNHNITFGLIGRGAAAGRKNMRDLSDCTVIVVADEIQDESSVRATAEMVLSAGCKNVAFCGDAGEDLRYAFEKADREISGFNDATGYDDFAVMWGIEDKDALAEEVSACWNEVLILCDSMSILKECRELVA